jgi:hypothetical protein
LSAFSAILPSNSVFADAILVSIVPFSLVTSVIAFSNSVSLSPRALASASNSVLVA